MGRGAGLLGLTRGLVTLGLGVRGALGRVLRVGGRFPFAGFFCLGGAEGVGTVGAGASCCWGTAGGFCEGSGSGVCVQQEAIDARPRRGGGKRLRDRCAHGDRSSDGARKPGLHRGRSGHLLWRHQGRPSLRERWLLGGLPRVQLGQEGPGGLVRVMVPCRSHQVLHCGVELRGYGLGGLGPWSASRVPLASGDLVPLTLTCRVRVLMGLRSGGAGAVSGGERRVVAVPGVEITPGRLAHFRCVPGLVALGAEVAGHLGDGVVSHWF